MLVAKVKPGPTVRRRRRSLPRKRTSSTLVLRLFFPELLETVECPCAGTYQAALMLLAALTS